MAGGRDAGTNGAGAVPLKSAQMMGTPPPLLYPHPLHTKKSRKKREKKGGKMKYKRKRLQYGSQMEAGNYSSTIREYKYSLTYNNVSEVRETERIGAGGGGGREQIKT